MEVDLLSNLVKALTANGTAYPTIVATATAPSGSGVIDVYSAASGATRRYIKLIPFGTDAADETFVILVTGWSYTGDLWVPSTLCEVTCTMGTKTGVAAKTVINTEYFADTLALVGTSGNSGVSVELLSPADNTIAHLVIDVKGNRYVQVSAKAGTGVNGNALYQLL